MTGYSIDDSPYMQRVVEEKRELDVKLQALGLFITNSPVFRRVHDADKTLLRAQRDAMRDYSEILTKRIESYKLHGARLAEDTLETVDKPAETVVETPVPVDRTARTLVDGSPVIDDEHREIQADGMQKGYVVLSAAERAKGFVRPVRQSYRHDSCGAFTTMGLALAETYARDPTFYRGTFCASCRAHFPVGPDGEFTWAGTQERVGT